MTAQVAPQPSSGWTVTSQMETTQRDATGLPVSGVKVYFTTGQNVAGSVFIPDTLYTTDNARQLIATRAAQLDAVGALSADGS